ncbi:hypothetical protein RJ639_027230 [Escallonia herrerae]|uniref:Uncharacterized protein n=1 Tax=Escallonia herrerae TaxID=1293975 RepID=A0AA88X5C3_9ASTE|nr:hypothetical protein RJ639_027230 [Escallonia herrerae]
MLISDQKPEYVDWDGETDEPAMTEEVYEDATEISVQALAGNITRRLVGWANKSPFTILVDTGSTDNFMDPKSAARLGCQLTPITPLPVAVANGAKGKEADRLWPKRSTQSDDEEEERAGPELPIPGNSMRSGDHRVVGSLSPPRHCRTNANAAKVNGSAVSNKRILEDDEGVGLEDE